MIRSVIISLVIDWIVRTFHLPMQLGSAATKPSYEYPAPPVHPINVDAPYRPDVSVGNGNANI